DTLFPCELWVLYQKGMISHEYKNKKTNPLSQETPEAPAALCPSYALHDSGSLCLRLLYTEPFCRRRLRTGVRDPFPPWRLRRGRNQSVCFRQRLRHQQLSAVTDRSV